MAVEQMNIADEMDTVSDNGMVDLINGRRRLIRCPAIFRNKTFYIVTGVIVIATAIIVPLAVKLFLTEDCSQYKQESESYLCLSRDCIIAAAYMVRKLNVAVDPCEDMYNFSCGNMLAKAKIPAGEFIWDMDNEVADKIETDLYKLLQKDTIEIMGKSSKALSKAKHYYQTCLNQGNISTHGIQNIQLMISQFGSWTLTSANIDEWKSKNWNLQWSVEKMHMLGIYSLFRTIIDWDKDVSQYVIKFDGGLAIPSTFLQTSDKFVTMVTEIAKLLGGDPETVSSKVQDIYKFEKKMAEIFEGKEEQSLPHETTYIDLGELKSHFKSWINIEDYLKKTLSGKYRNDSRLSVVSSHYFSNLNELIRSTSHETQANYMIWAMINVLTDYMPIEFNKIKQDVQFLNDTNRTELCLGKTFDNFGFALSAAYINEDLKTHKNRREIASFTAEKVREEFISNLETIHWLDDKSRETLEEEATSIDFRIGYPDWILNVTKLDLYYEGLQIASDDDFLKCYEYVTAFTASKDIVKYYNNSYDNDEWLVVPIETIPTYLDNAVYITSAYLQFPFFEESFPPSVYYPNIAFTIGHEMLHAYDKDTLSEVNGEIFATSTAREGFHNQLQCLVDQYSQYSVQEQYSDANGSLNDNMCDNGGFMLAYQVYKKYGESSDYLIPFFNFTKEQMFFTAYSQVWCTVQIKSPSGLYNDEHTEPKFRVNGVLSNSIEFSKAFNCKKGSKMNPEKKCEVWR
ncbi:endothelin-converting enzyme 2 [Biomphalaria pfeifferi]|uniref:Endothelin-converting enzyme 2 n=1 Tax=Biomphalaria pfeifferi TaxID=112525 RepID=A0AAD8AYL6_BIOPF|nr:endothelin-converting enzyme 2 [Biomphalaria pfeifferi]